MCICMYIDDLLYVYMVMIHMKIVAVMYKVSLINIKLCIIVNNVLKLIWYVWLLFCESVLNKIHM